MVWACGWWEPDVSESSAFAPESFAGAQYTPFFYEPDYPFYGDESYSTNSSGRFDENVVQDWLTYLKRPESDSSVAYFLLKASAELIDSVYRLPASQLPASLQGMYLVQHRSNKKISSFFRFLTFAKANEPYAKGPDDYWGYDPVPARQLEASDIARIDSMTAEMKRSKDAFLLQRYYFQIVRAYYFAQDYDACLRFYEEHKSLLDESLFASRITAYSAGALYKQKKFGMANYRYSRIFAQHPEQRLVAEYSFHPQEEADWKESLALCRTGEERIGMWLLMGIYNDEQRAIAEIYRIDPASDKLDLLLSRLVNITEASSATDGADRQQRNEGKDGTFIAVNADRLAAAISLLQHITEAHNTHQPFAWHMALGYLYFLKGDARGATTQFDAAAKYTPAQSLGKDQLHMLRIMNLALTSVEMNKEQEQALLPELEWMQQRSADTARTRLRLSGAYSWIKGLLSERYRRKGNLLFAELYDQDLNFYNDAQRAQQMKNFIRSAQLSPYERYMRSIYPYSASDVAAVQAIVAAFSDRLPEAVNLMSEVPEAEQVTLPGNPFNNRIQDCHDCDHAAPQKVKYTRLDFLKKMQEMRANVDAGKDVYNNALLLGNAFYNMSVYGNARSFYQSAITGEINFAEDFASDFFRGLILSQERAAHYLQLALKAAANDEQRAKITYLLLKCKRNDYYTHGSETGAEEIPPIPYASLYAFSNTRYYQEVLSECGYFATFVKRKK
ncbi:hypothetical protein GCM10023092_21870 [Rurimicrobium arvi]|uniref:Tetratricopeptide repeat protein n=2 Tax=Rurimicrobium arvi TaxID=2049916 RepID=A0ABP8MXQ9_9BACT